MRAHAVSDAHEPKDPFMRDRTCEVVNCSQAVKKLMFDCKGS